MYLTPRLLVRGGQYMTGFIRGHGPPPEELRRHGTHPLRLRSWKGCLWIDLDEMIVASQKIREVSQTVVDGGSQTIWACRRLLHGVTFSIENDHF